MEKSTEWRKSALTGNGENYSIVDDNKLCDSCGNVIATAHRIFYIGHGNFLLEDEQERQKIFDKNKRTVEINLPAGIAITPWTIKLPCPSLGHGCYLAQNGTNSRKQGIATNDELILPCEYEIDRYFNELQFRTENPSLLIVRKEKGGYVDGIFDLSRRQFVLPCGYHFHDYKDGLLCISRQSNRGYKWGIFDTKSLKVIVPPKYDSIKLCDNKKCKCVTYKNKLWFGKYKKNEIEIQL